MVAGALQAVEDPRSWTSRSVRDVSGVVVRRGISDGGLEGGVAVFRGGGCSVEEWVACGGEQWTCAYCCRAAVEYLVDPPCAEIAVALAENLGVGGASDGDHGGCGGGMPVGIDRWEGERRPLARWAGSKVCFSPISSSRGFGSPLCGSSTSPCVSAPYAGKEARCDRHGW